MSMFWRNNAMSKLLWLGFVLGLFLILELQIQRLQFHVEKLRAVESSIGKEDLDFLNENDQRNEGNEELFREANDVWGTDDDQKEEEIDEEKFSILSNAFERTFDKNMIAPKGERTIIFYNRVPKTGSTSFMGVIYALCSKINYHVIHLNVSKNRHVMSVADQIRFARNITTWKEKMPAFYHGHQSFIDFNKLGFEHKPLYINIVRKPLERLVSYYYFLRHGDDFRPRKKRARQGNQESFDKCVLKGHRDCQLDHLWLQIPFFCGQHPECWEPGNKWALKNAKKNLVKNYLVVGVTERLPEFIAVMEVVLPRFFRVLQRDF